MQVKRLRRDSGLTQEELADIIGKNPTAISQIERGVFNPSLDTIEALANAFKVPAGAFFPDVSGLRGKKKRDAAVSELTAITFGLNTYDIETLNILATGLKARNDDEKT
ncbi:MAG: helix-turn-helix transcriptional regulator [Pseudomonadota bacterium]